MKTTIKLFILICCLFWLQTGYAQNGLIAGFKLEQNDLELRRIAKPGAPFDRVGHKFALLGEESGSFEAWAYPLKLFRNFEFSFFTGSSTRPVFGKDIVCDFLVTPEAAVLTYTYQSFTVRAIFITPVEEAGAVILLDVDSTEPLTIVCGFIPVLQPMWPAGIGGQYAYWNNELSAYIISESTRKNHGLIGSPAASVISYTPAHKLSDTPSEFKIIVEDPLSVRGKLIPIILAGGKGKREDVIAIYRKLSENPEYYYRKNLEHYKNLREKTLRIKTPDLQINLAFEWAKVAYDNLVVDNPDLGKGLVAGLGMSGTSGRPGFGWYFGGDAYINSFSMNSYGAYHTVRDVLAFTQKWQRKDGKMAHELSQAEGYVDWWNDYHYGYIHGDTTPFYITAMYDYLKMSGDADFIKDSWKSLKNAYEWCLKTDANNDGLMDNKKAGLGALEYGALTGIETDIYLAAVWTRAAYSMQYLAEACGKKLYAKKAAQDFQKAKSAFNEKFWDEESQFYSYAFNTKGGHVNEISPWNAVGLMWNFGEPQRSLLSLEKINSSELTTDWGIRSISINSKYYQPLNYNYGAVWPFLTSWVTTAQFKHHLPLQGYNSLMATVRHTFDHGLGCITEVFSGSQNIWPQEAVAHQGFSTAGAVLPLVRGLLGLEGDAIKKEIQFAPHFPANWDSVTIDNYKIGKAAVSFVYTKSKEKIVIGINAVQADNFTLFMAPALGIGSKIKKVWIDKKNVQFKQIVSEYVIQPVIDVSLSNGKTVVVIEYEPTVELLPPEIDTRTGDTNKGLKIISIKKRDKELTVIVEGLSGEIYYLGLVNPHKIADIAGAVLIKDKIKIQIPEGKPAEFITHKITIIIK